MKKRKLGSQGLEVSALKDNLGALDVVLTDEDLQRIDTVLPPGAGTGTRYAAPQMAALNR